MPALFSAATIKHNKKRRGEIIRILIQGGPASPEDDAKMFAEGAKRQLTTARTEKLGGKAAFV